MNAFERAGHSVRYRSIRKRGWKKLLDRRWDLVAVAGGDGAVAKVAITLAARRKMPLAVIPSGRANNIARALGLQTGRREGRLAVAVARGPWGKTHFVESAGVGPIASLMTREGLSFRAGVVQLRRAFEAARPIALRVRADGEDLSGDYLMAQVLNVNAIGPRLELARDADPGDEWLELLLIRPEQRQVFMTFLAARARGKAARCPIATIRARRIEIGGWPARQNGQVDDRPWPDRRSPRVGKVRIRVATQRVLAARVKGDRLADH